MKPLRIGIIGLGAEGNVHARQFIQTCQARIVAVCDLDVQRVMQAAGIYGADYATHDYRHLLNRSKLDAISIATVNSSHYPIAIAALRAGIHVFCEKPLALTLAQAEDLVETADCLGVIHGINFKHRCMANVVFLHHLIRSGKLGRIVYARAAYFQDWLVRPTASATGARNWRTNSRQSGTGVLNDLGSHLVDLIQYLIGDIFVTQSTSRIIAIPPTETAPAERNDDFIDIQATTLTDTVVEITASRAMLGYTDHLSLLIQGTKAAVRITNHHLDTIDFCAIEEANQATWTTLHVPEYTSRSLPVERFVKGLVSGDLPTPNFHDGLRVQQVLTMAENSVCNPYNKDVLTTLIPVLFQFCEQSSAGFLDPVSGDGANLREFGAV
jgi:predicted dehydrogenase